MVTLGYVRHKSLVPAFASKLKTTPMKKISDPFQSRFGWHILYIENIRSIDDTNTIVRKNIAQRIRIDKANVNVMTGLLNLKTRHILK